MSEYQSGLSEHAYRYIKMGELVGSSLQRFLFFSKRLSHSLTTVPQEVISSYEKYESIITEIYGDEHLAQNNLFHGTGRYHYSSENGNKYSLSAARKITDVLSIVLSRGLQPQRDIWVSTPASRPTISLKHQRFYARWYADKHDSDDLLWSYGNSIDWASMFVLKNISTLLDVPYITALVRTQSKRNSSGGLLGSVHSWVSDVKNDISPRTSYSDALQTKSTIPHNFGTVFVIKEANVLTYDFPLLRKTEKRTLDTISPEVITAIEVPLNYIGTVGGIVDKMKLGHIQTLPIECVDYHFSKFSISELTHVDNDTHLIKPNRQDIDYGAYDFNPLTSDAVHTVLESPLYTPQKLLALLTTSPLLHSLLSQQCNWEGFSLRYHTLAGLHIFEEFCAQPNALPPEISREFFRIFFSLHDSGDSLGRSTHEKLAYNQLLCVKFMKDFHFDVEEILIAEALLSDDPIGSYLKKVGTLAEILNHTPLLIQSISIPFFQSTVQELAAKTILKIEKMALSAQMSYSNFLKLITLFHTVDAGAYTSVGGSIGSLNYVFDFDVINRKVEYSQNVRTLVNLLGVSM